MSATSVSPVLSDPLGPRGRRRVLVASLVAGAVLAWLLYVAYGRLSDKGQLDWERWEPFTQRSVIEFLFEGLVKTIEAAAVGMVLAVVLGGVLALMRLSQTAPVRWLAAAWVEFFRGFPLLLLIFFTFFALPKYGIDLSPYQALVLALGVYNGAVLGEIFRAGIQSLDRGQTEAAYALGLSYWRTMSLVVIPQAVRRMVPAIVGQLVTLLKDTSLGFVISYEELLRRSRINGEFFRNPLQAIVVAAGVYIAVNITLGRIARRLEVRQRRRLGAGPLATTAAGDDLAAAGLVAEAALSENSGA